MSDAGDLSNFSMLDLFRVEVETQVAVLNDGLLTLERDVEAADLESLMRAAHSIKGAARMVGVDAATKLAHDMEDYFVAIQGRQFAIDPSHLDVLFRGIDLMVRISQLQEGEGWLAENQEQVEGVQEALAAISRGEVHAATQIKSEIEAAPVQVQQDPVPEPTGSASNVQQEQPEAELPPPAEVPAAAGAPSDADRVVRVTADNLNRLMGLAGEALVGTRWLHPFAESLQQLKAGQADLAEEVEVLKAAVEAGATDDGLATQVTELQRQSNHCRQLLADRLNELESFSQRSENLSDRLYHEVIDSRMRPFADGIGGFPRMVRDLARSLGKTIHFVVEGQATRVDRDILAKLEAPLNHLIRNAIDHGIETPEERLALGKPEEGSIRLEAGHRAGMLSITLEDDGRGVELERLREKVRERELADEEMVSQMSEIELMEFLFLPGFTTSAVVTEISGRGVGLDVVQSMVQGVGGVLRAQSQPGKGMSFHLQLPLTLSVTRTLLVEVEGDVYAFPLGRVDRVLRVPQEEVEVIEDRQYVRFDEQSIGLVPAHQILALGDTGVSGEELLVVVLSDRMDRYGLVVDRLLGERDLVVRPLDPRLANTRDISAVAFLDDNSPVLIVDVEDMVRSIDNLVTGGRLRKMKRAAQRVSERKRRRVLVVDDSITVREVERKLLENNGYEVEVAVDGMDGWNAVRTGVYDLIITDVDMPRMNGIELVQSIKSDPQLQDLPVMIVSYKDREEDRLRGLEAGANYYLTKSSFHDETLVSAVVDLIGTAQDSDRS